MHGLRFILEYIFYTQSVMLSPRSLLESMFYSQSVVRRPSSVVRSPQSMFYTYRVPNLTLNLGRLGTSLIKKNGGYCSDFQRLIPVHVSSYFFLYNW